MAIYHIYRDSHSFVCKRAPAKCPNGANMIYLNARANTEHKSTIYLRIQLRCRAILRNVCDCVCVGLCGHCWHFSSMSAPILSGKIQKEISKKEILIYVETRKSTRPMAIQQMHSKWRAIGIEQCHPSRSNQVKNAIACFRTFSDPFTSMRQLIIFEFIKAALIVDFPFRMLSPSSTLATAKLFKYGITWI